MRRDESFCSITVGNRKGSGYEYSIFVANSASFPFTKKTLNFPFCGKQPIPFFAPPSMELYGPWIMWYSGETGFGEVWLGESMYPSTGEKHSLLSSYPISLPPLHTEEEIN